MADMTTATTIRDQIGHKAFVMMGTPKGSFVGDEGYLHFDIKGCRKYNRISVKLDASDTYSVGFHKIGKAPYHKVVSRFIDYVHAESLHNVISTETGLYLSL